MIAWRWCMLAISSGGFIGFIPGWLTKRPGKFGGTAGSLFAVIIQVLLLMYVSNPVAWSLGFIVITMALGLLSISTGERLMYDKWGSGKRHTGKVVKHDRNETCIDEICGQLLAGLPVFLLPLDAGHQRIIGLIIAFILFRLFDGYKPWPIKTIEQWCGPTAFGIMFDDIVAGIIVASIITLNNFFG